MTIGVGIVFGLDGDNDVVVVAAVIPVMSVDGWCNVVAGGGCDDITMLGASVFMGTATVDEDDDGIIVDGDVVGIIILTDPTSVVSTEGVVEL